MSQTVRLSNELVELAKIMGKVMSRSSAKQIEHWVKIGRIAEENPDLPYSFIKESLIAKAEMDAGLVSDYELEG
ncbi:ParD-like family protein [Thiotrichales bacterium 19S9-12]|nr:ParD-like family protein [Thiotrichales bacterium 19S9-11]MCF6810975.1 ParD-like family protein [Thiotrichales bacterium 19S9-12]